MNKERKVTRAGLNGNAHWHEDQKDMGSILASPVNSTQPSNL